MLEKTPSRPEQMLLFARNFVKHPVMLGSLIPSSRFLIEQVLKQIDWRRARAIVEYGPGVGTFTTEILRRLHPDGVLMVIETNAEFVRFLQMSIRDPRLRVIHGSAADVGKLLQEHGLETADYVISGIPFSTMPEEVRDSILRTTHDVLRPNGAFLVYQFSAKVRPYLEKVFGRVQRDSEIRNILPARLFFCSP
ncbi:MAG: methyltransferase [Gemmatimonadota bacterium]|nr:methyltransferase [Gemmatimonadota bacterium]